MKLLWVSCPPTFGVAAWSSGGNIRFFQQAGNGWGAAAQTVPASNGAWQLEPDPSFRGCLVLPFFPTRSSFRDAAWPVSGRLPIRFPLKRWDLPCNNSSPVKEIAVGDCFLGTCQQ